MVQFNPNIYIIISIVLSVSSMLSINSMSRLQTDLKKNIGRLTVNVIFS